MWFVCFFLRFGFASALDVHATRAYEIQGGVTHEAETTERMSLCAMRVNDLHVPRGLTKLLGVGHPRNELLSSRAFRRYITLGVPHEVFPLM
jgi:hypothetical protein